MAGIKDSPYPSDIYAEIKELIPECDPEKIKDLLMKTGVPLKYEIFDQVIKNMSQEMSV